MQSMNLTQLERHCLLLPALFFITTMALSAKADLVTVSSVETWDGVANPHVADGVLLSGAGTPADPAVYTIPDGMHITATGAIYNAPTGATIDRSIRFNISGGDLTMDAGALLDISRNTRDGLQHFILDLGGNNVTGAGKIRGIKGSGTVPRQLTIENVNNVTLRSIDLHTVNPNVSRPPLTITANGAVVVTGPISNSDWDTGGDHGGDVTIQAASIDVFEIDTRALRSDQSKLNGNVVLRALAPPGYSQYDSINNSPANKVTAWGTINTRFGPLGGNVTIEGVVMQFNPGFRLFMPDAATLTLKTGAIGGGAGAGDLFIDYAYGGSGLSPSFEVQWSGTVPPPPSGSPPAFVADEFTRPNAKQDVSYTGTLAGTAADPDLDPVFYSKGYGPAWLEIAPDGTLSGTPVVTNGGTNVWLIAVSDGQRFDTAFLTIFVDSAPFFPRTTITKPNATQDVAYANSLATNVTYYGNNPLTFFKFSGPDWLTVASDGTIYGTPSASDVLIGTYNTWSIRVTDGVYTNAATLRITVNGPPKFASNPLPYPNARVGVEYGNAGVSLATFVQDPQGLQRHFSKIDGPSWLSIDFFSGLLYGTPSEGDAGENTWTVSVGNQVYGAAQGTLVINVLSAAAPPGVVTVSFTEAWDGTANPRAAEGVTLDPGLGTEASPAVYTIPNGLHITGTGAIYNAPFGATIDKSIRFNISGGDLTMDAGALLDISRNTRSDRQVFILDLSETNSIIGAGRIRGIKSSPETPRVLFITNVNNVAFADIDVKADGPNNTGRHMFVTASGAVVVTGVIDNRDISTGGDHGCDVTILAGSINVNRIDTRTARTQKNSGNIVLRALAAPGYDPNDGVNNTFMNRLTVNGLLNTLGPDPLGGNVTLEGVAVSFGPLFSLLKPDPAVLTLNAGVVQSPAKALDLFTDLSGSGLTPVHSVQWSGNIVPALRSSASGGILTLEWGGDGFVLQQNSPDIGNPSGWVNVPGGNVNPIELPMTNALPTFFRLKSQ